MNVAESEFIEQVESNKFTDELIELVKHNEELLKNYNVMFDNLIEKTKKSLVILEDQKLASNAKWIKVVHKKSLTHWSMKLKNIEEDERCC
ncbi:hypothetical protein F8M41_007286 [Gigaspora margarita]|uniref:Uncharacterized protein n=1 Tax=Gigaspora margarita TaxID=4874 RepID=A0A8H4AWI9_GIGMA|nr:hypothetical protein F8M41_007286 [Gigaspora margarita]